MRPKFFIAVIICSALFLLALRLYTVVQWDQYDSLVDNISRNTCLLVGGKRIETGCGIAKCTSKCVFPSRDGGKSCQSSDECARLCVVTSPGMGFFTTETSEELSGCHKGKDGLFDCSTQHFQASCQTLPQRNCETLWEYDRGIVRRLDVDCTM